MLLQRAKDDARCLILAVAYLGSKKAQRAMEKVPQLSEFAGVHPLPAQRYFNVLCMAYVADPNLFADAVRDWHLPEVRAKHRRYEYLRFQYAYRTLIDPYIEKALVEHIEPKGLLAFESE